MLFDRADPPIIAALKGASVGTLIALCALVFLVSTTVFDALAAQMRLPASFAILAGCIISTGIIATARPAHRPLP